MFHDEETRNRGTGSTWIYRLGALRVAICLTLLMLKPKSSALLEISSAGVCKGKWRITAFIEFSEFLKKVK
jgi:hypothetical protein